MNTVHQFAQGQEVEVFDIKRKRWLAATILRYWACVTIPSGVRADQVDVEGTDELGPFHGRWDINKVRLLEAV